MITSDSPNSTQSNMPPPPIPFESSIMLWYSAMMFITSFFLFVFAFFTKNSRNLRFIHASLDISAYSSLYFALSVSLVVYNKWLISIWQGGFRYPLIITLIHMSLKLCISWSVVKTCSPRISIPRVSKWTYFLYACPVGVATGLDVAASNGSLYYVSITLYTVIKSTSLIFVLGYSLLYGLQSCEKMLVVITGVICVGVLMASYGDTKFDGVGFAMVFIASALGGYRWALTEVLMNRIGNKMNSLMTIYTISPASVGVLVPFAVWLEGGDLRGSKFYLDKGLFVVAILNVCGSGLFAFAMIYVELAVLNRTSSLSLVVIGYLKQMAQIIVSVIVFHEVLSPLNIGGIVMTFFGMGLYAFIKHRASLQKNALSAHGAAGGGAAFGGGSSRRSKRKTRNIAALVMDEEDRIPLAGPILAAEEYEMEEMQTKSTRGAYTEQRQSTDDSPFVQIKHVASSVDAVDVRDVQGSEFSQGDGVAVVNGRGVAVVAGQDAVKRT